MKVTIELPGINAISRNQTTGHFVKYHQQLTKAEQWISTFGYKNVHHFDKQVDVFIYAYYDMTPVEKIIARKDGKVYKRKDRVQLIDSPNIDDKIFTDIIQRWKYIKDPRLGKIKTERKWWWIEDDDYAHLRDVHKGIRPSNEYKVEIIITDEI